MTYELAKQLKDAEFPQGGGGKWIGPPQKIVWRHDDRAYYPTLEELIEAIEPLGALTLQWNGEEWTAETNLHPKLRGSTPAEAVGRLWLALTEHGPN
jgi:hypothetical protein